jgi:hypothetical protein
MIGVAICVVARLEGDLPKDMDETRVLTQPWLDAFGRAMEEAWGKVGGVGFSIRLAENASDESLKQAAASAVFGSVETLHRAEAKDFTVHYSERRKDKGED